MEHYPLLYNDCAILPFRKKKKKKFLILALVVFTLIFFLSFILLLAAYNSFSSRLTVAAAVWQQGISQREREHRN